MTESKYEEDVAVFNDFLAESKADTLTDAHPVMSMTDHWSKVVAKKYGCDSCQREDMKQAALLSLLSESNYEGRCSLKNYIVRVLVSKVTFAKAPPVKGPRKPKKGEDSDAEKRIVFKYVMLDDNTDEVPIIELADERSENLVDKVLRRLAYDELMEDKVASMPELQRIIVEIVTEFEENLGSRRIAKEAAQRLGRNVTRYQVEIALTQLAVIVGAALWR